MLWSLLFACLDFTFLWCHRVKWQLRSKYNCLQQQLEDSPKTILWILLYFLIVNNQNLHVCCEHIQICCISRGWILHKKTAQLHFEPKNISANMKQYFGENVLCLLIPRTSLTKILWAENPNLVTNLCCLCEKYLTNHVTILHMSWQLSCHDMCKTVTWLDHYKQD